MFLCAGCTKHIVNAEQVEILGARAHGATKFKSLEVAVLAGHLGFSLLATAGKASRTFARTIQQGVEGSASDQPAPVYRAL